jgi:AcrR family transcriptional regulator
VAGQGSKEQRREEILESTWKLIAREGLSATNMRSLAAAAGYANGALSYYFNGKDDLLRAAFEYVLKQTSLRMAEATRGLTGLAALRAFCLEILPDSELKLLEARVVLPFWSSAVTEPAFAQLHEQAMSAWRRQMRRYLAEAVEARELAAPARPQQHAETVEALLSLLTGDQILALLSPKQHTPRMMRSVLSTFLAGLAAPA